MRVNARALSRVIARALSRVIARALSHVIARALSRVIARALSRVIAVDIRADFDHFDRLMASRIGPDIRIAGALVASEDLSIAGIVEGTVTVLGSLTIERGAQISGEVTARDVVLLGELHVPIRATASVRLGPTAVLCADLSAARLIIEEGAVLEGHVRTTRNLDAAQLRPTIQAVAAAQPAVATTPSAPSLPATTTHASHAPSLPKQTPREAPAPRSAPVESAVRPRAAAPAPAPTPSPVAPRAAEPRRSERDREIPELPSIGRQKLVRR